MNNHPEDAGIIQTILDRFNNQRFPRTMAMKEKVDRGEKLEKFEVDYLAEVLEDARSLHALIERHPEYQPLVIKAFDLYKEISEKALANEKS